MSQVTVYTLPACPQCDATKRFFNRNLIDFDEVKLQEDSGAYEIIKAKGFTQAPVVMAGEELWSGFRLEKLEAIKANVSSAVV